MEDQIDLEKLCRTADKAMANVDLERAIEHAEQASTKPVEPMRAPGYDFDGERFDS